VRRGVDTLLHREAGLDRAAFPGAEACFATTVSIPIYPSLSGSERDRVLAAARAVFSTATVS
jgi:dTDP-4-amino-4,6-dideoxygalactose transaminase